MRRPYVVLAVACLLGTVAPAGADPAKDVVITVTDSRIVESSGLVARNGDFLTVNDSGDVGRVYVVDGETGKTVGVTSWSDTPTDVEAIAPATGDEIWLGDIGDNRQRRPWIEVTRLAVQEGDRDEIGETFRLGYPQGALNAEALLVNPVTGRLYVASKVALGGDLYEAPETLDPIEVNMLNPIGPVGLLVTDGAFFPDGKHLILRGYGRATVYSFPDMRIVGTLDLPREPQGEGIAVSADGEVFICSEGKDQPVLRVKLPAAVVKAMAPTTPSETTSPSPGTPSESAEGGSSDASDSSGSSDASDSSGSSGVRMLSLAAGGVVGLGVLLGGGMFLRRRSR